MDATTYPTRNKTYHAINRPHPATGKAFTFRPDGWFNMTSAAKTFGKDLQSFVRMDDTRAYIEALQANSVSQTEFLGTQVGRLGGTWAHPKLAVFFARWLDVRFSVWCDSVIDDILRGKAAVEITEAPRGIVARAESRSAHPQRAS